MTVLDVLGVAGFLSFISIQVSLLKTTVQISSMGHTGQFSPVPNVATATNCAVGSIYALMVHRVPLFLANLCGLLVCLYCIHIFKTYQAQSISTSRYWSSAAQHQQQQQLPQLWLYIAPCVIVAITLAFALSHMTRFVGVIMMFGAVAMLSSPLATAADVISSQSCESMPLSTSLACMFNGAIWALYGYKAHDFFILIPNAAGGLLAAVQMGMWCYYDAGPLLMEVVADFYGYLTLDSYSDIDAFEDEEASLNGEDESVFSDISIPGPHHHRVALRLPPPLAYERSVPQTEQQQAAELELLSPQSDISDITWGTTRASRLSQLVNALSPLGKQQYPPPATATQRNW